MKQYVKIIIENILAEITADIRNGNIINWCQNIEMTWHDHFYDLSVQQIISSIEVRICRNAFSLPLPLSCSFYLLRSPFFCTFQRFMVEFCMNIWQYSHEHFYNLSLRLSFSRSVWNLESFFASALRALTVFIPILEGYYARQQI